MGKREEAFTAATAAAAETEDTPGDGVLCMVVV